MSIVRNLQSSSSLLAGRDFESLQDRPRFGAEMNFSRLEDQELCKCGALVGLGWSRNMGWNDCTVTSTLPTCRITRPLSKTFLWEDFEGSAAWCQCIGAERWADGNRFLSSLKFCVFTASFVKWKKRLCWANKWTISIKFFFHLGS